MKKGFAALIIFFLLCFPAWSATYYMRADGTAANKEAATGPASSAAACMSIATHNGETFAAGDIIYLSSQGGTYSSLFTPPSSGSSGSPITYQAVSGETPTLDVAGATTFSVTNISYITLDGLTLQDATTRCLFIRAQTTDITGFVVQNCAFSNDQSAAQAIQFFAEDYDISSITISNCTFSNMQGNGIVFFFAGADNTGVIHTVTIEDCIFDTLTDGVAACAGIETTFANSANALAADRLAYGVTIQDNTFTDTNSSAIRVYLTDTALNLISNNTITGAGFNSDRQVNAIQLHYCKSLTVEYNTVSNTGTSGVGDGCGIILDWGATDSSYICDSCVVRYNHCYDNNDSNSVTSSGINAYRATNCEIYYNICSGNHQGIVLNTYAGAPSSGNVFYNNTIVNNGYDGVLIVTDAPTSTWTNNIIANNGAEGVDDNSANDPTFTYNCLHNNTGGNYSGFTLGTGCIETDPLFGLDYKLSINSPCIDTGTDIFSGTASINDYSGYRITNGDGEIIKKRFDASMGAYHYYPAYKKQPCILKPVAHGLTLYDER